MDNIIYRDIPGYSGKYQAGDDGSIMSLNFANGKLGKLLKGCIDNDGYRIVTLYNGVKDGKYRQKITWKIHRLIAYTFLPNSQNKPQVNHINGIKTDNRLQNLEWCTISENAIHAVNTGLWKYDNNHLKNKHPMKGKFGGNHNRSKKVISYNKDMTIDREWDSIRDAERELGARVSNISKCCRENNFTCKGFYWRYA